MIQFNELRLSPNKKYLIIDTQIEELDYFKECYLESIQIEVFSKSDNFISPVPSSKALTVWSAPATDTVKRARIYRDIDSLLNYIIFVYVIADGNITEDAPCGGKDRILLGIVYDKEILYRRGIDLLKTLNDCEPSKELIDYILNYNAFKLSLDTGDYKSAIDYWNKSFKNKLPIKTGCGCHGY